MAQRGICSRREADRYIEAGQVLVDGAVISELGTKVSPSANVELMKKAAAAQNRKVTILLNKPIGYVSTQPEKGYTPAIDLITPDSQWYGKRGRSSYKGPRFHRQHLSRLSVVGRLDIESKGLLIFTQDGTLARKLIGPDARTDKEYIVGVEGSITDETIEKLRFGLSLDEKPLRRAKVDLLEPQLLRIVLNEGKKRQIRRMCELVGLRVVRLKRVRVGGVRLSDLPEGQWRYLEQGETF